MLRNGHVRFGGRVGETDRRQRRHRAPARPYPVVDRCECPSWRWISGSGITLVQQLDDRNAGAHRLTVAWAESARGGHPISDT